MTKDIPNLQVVKGVCRVMGRSFKDSVEYVKDRPGHDRRYAVDWSKIKKELGWLPKHNFETWLAKTVAWYQENEDWWRPLKQNQKAYFKKQYGKK